MVDPKIGDKWSADNTALVIRTIMLEAVKAEREACAKIALDYVSALPRPTVDTLRNEIAAAIRARP